VARYDGPAADLDGATAIGVDSSSNVYITGMSLDLSFDVDYATVKYDAMGIEQWVVRYDGPLSQDDMAKAVMLDGMGDVYVTGSSEGLYTDFDYATVKYNASGVEQWASRYNYPIPWGLDMAHAIVLDKLGSVYVTGRSFNVNLDSDYATLKYDSSGTQQWAARYNGPAQGCDVANAIGIDNMNNIYVTGSSVGNGTDLDYTTLKYTPLAIMENSVIAGGQDEIITTIFSHHLRLPTRKRCRVFDITGRVVDPARIQPGIYFIEVDGVVTQKVVKVE
jgi:hypothetical protein